MGQCAGDRCAMDSSTLRHEMRRLNPYAEYAYDGLALNPLEVMFVKVKGFQVQGDWASAQLATTYQRWLGTHVRALQSCKGYFPGP